MFKEKKLKILKFDYKFIKNIMKYKIKKVENKIKFLK